MAWAPDLAREARPGLQIAHGDRRLGRPLRMFLTADRDQEADWYREAPTNNRNTPCIPSRKGRKTPVPDDGTRHRQRHKIENSFAGLKDWRRGATRDDRCAKGVLSACALADGLMFWS